MAQMIKFSEAKCKRRVPGTVDTPCGRPAIGVLVDDKGVVLGNYEDDPRPLFVCDRCAPAEEGYYAKYQGETIFIQTSSEAEDVLRYLKRVIQQYGHATHGDLYDLVGLKAVREDERIGWTNLVFARVVESPDGFMLFLPKWQALD